MKIKVGYQVLVRQLAFVAADILWVIIAVLCAVAAVSVILTSTLTSASMRAYYSETLIAQNLSYETPSINTLRERAENLAPLHSGQIDDT